MATPRETTDLVAMDLSDAVAYVVFRLDPANPYTVTVESAARGISKQQAAILLRQLAQVWEVDSQ